MVIIRAGERALESTPFFDHSRQEFGSVRVEGWVEMYGNAQRGWRSHQVALRRMENGAISEKFVDRHLIPPENVEWIQVINNSQRIDFVHARDDAMVFDVGKAADVEDEFRASAL